MKFLGNRIVKTAVAVFITAFVCNMIGWPPVFAVITAIVTLEPTVTDSIKKGMVRFPASAIGSFYAVLFISFFGNSAITYTLAATLTILTCYRLKLHAGLLVATITAVAMVEVVYDNYLLSFFIRLGTTTIGLVVSTLVNLLIFPPNYISIIKNNISGLYHDIGDVLNNILEETINLEHIEKKIVKTEELIRYQQDESHFHPLLGSNKESFSRSKQDIDTLRVIHYHLSNLQEINIDFVQLKEENKKIIRDAAKELANHMTKKESFQVYHHEKELRRLLELFWTSSHSINKIDLTQLPQELILLYELISIFHLAKRLEHLKD